MSPAEGEVIRARLKVRDLHTMLDQVEHDLRDPGPPGLNTAQAITQAAADLAMTLARLDAYRRSLPSTRAHITKYEQCVDACPACRENCARGFNPDGTRPEEEAPPPRDEVKERA